jgi:hypothetical protein
MSRSALDTIFEASQMIISTRYHLEALSHAFRRVGNEAIADELDDAAAGLLEAKRGIDAGVSEYVNNGLRQSQEATGNMLRAVLAASGVDPKPAE